MQHENAKRKSFLVNYVVRMRYRMIKKPHAAVVMHYYVLLQLLCFALLYCIYPTSLYTQGPVKVPLPEGFELVRTMLCPQLLYS